MFIVSLSYKDRRYAKNPLAILILPWMTILICTDKQILTQFLFLAWLNEHCLVQTIRKKYNTAYQAYLFQHVQIHIDLLIPNSIFIIYDWHREKNFIFIASMFTVNLHIDGYLFLLIGLINDSCFTGWSNRNREHTIKSKPQWSEITDPDKLLILLPLHWIHISVY